MTSYNTPPSIETRPGQQRGLKEFKDLMLDADCPDGLGLITDGWTTPILLGSVPVWEVIRTFDNPPQPIDNRRIL